MYYDRVYAFTEKNLRVSGLVQFKPMLWERQLYLKQQCFGYLLLPEKQPKTQCHKTTIDFFSRLMGWLGSADGSSVPHWLEMLTQPHSAGSVAGSGTSRTASFASLALGGSCWLTWLCSPPLGLSSRMAWASHLAVPFEGTKTDAARPLNAPAQKLRGNTSDEFCWLKQVTKPAQIRGEGK